MKDILQYLPHCFDTVGWVAGMASGPQKTEYWYADADMTGALCISDFWLAPLPYHHLLLQ